MITLARSAASVIHGLTRVLAAISLLGMLFVMLIVVYDVAVRHTGYPGVTGIVEYVEVGLALTVFFALGEAERRRAHVSVDLILGRLKRRSYVTVRTAAGVAAAVVAILLAWASLDVLADSIARGEYKLGLVSIPMWPARAAVFAGFAVLALEQVVSAIEDVLGGRAPLGGDPASAGHGL